MVLTPSGITKSVISFPFWSWICLQTVTGLLLLRALMDVLHHATISATFTVVSFEQSLKAHSPMFMSVLGMETEVSLEHPSKVRAPMDV